MIVMWLFLVVPWVCLQFVIVVFPDHTRLLFLSKFKEEHCGGGILKALLAAKFLY